MKENKIGEFIAKERKRKKLTQKDLADKLYVTDRAVSKWERGLSYPDILLLEKLSNILEVSVSELLNGERIENISKDKADDIVKDSISIYKEEEKKKSHKKVITASILSIASIIIVFVVYNIISINYFNGELYLTQSPKIDGNPEESKKAKAKTDEFMSCLKNKDINGIDNLLAHYLKPAKESSEQTIEENIAKYNEYLEEFYNTFTIIDYKYNYNYKGYKTIYTSEYEINMMYKDKKVFFYIQIGSDGKNIYLDVIGYEDDDKESMDFINNNQDLWNAVNNIFSHHYAIDNLNVEELPKL